MVWETNKQTNGAGLTQPEGKTNQSKYWNKCQTQDSQSDCKDFCVDDTEVATGK